MAIDGYLVLFAAGQIVNIAGAVIGAASWAVYTYRQHAKDKAESLAIQAEEYKNTLRDVTAYSARLENRVTELEAQTSILMQALKDARIKIPNGSPLTFNAGGDLTFGGGVTGRDSRP